ncbi:uncharacterized protein LOC103508600 [Diaphorina citri]|uniref:Uncharacterized protein LOC103508600 n=1 Tax=Diaphorina citri TaxID=121845 RepID=A0A1S4EB32_DIACI|nr:uncharacterized protein LOC103508600 [Diaphorina citri]
MIKHFLNLEVNELGDRIPSNLLNQPKMFHGSNFDNPNIGYKRLKVSGSAICKKMCEYPVIHLDLGDIDGYNESDILWTLYDKIDDVYKKQFPFLNETSYMHALSEENDVKLRYGRFSERGTVEYGEFKKSLTFLSNLLYKVYHNEPVILIDNYDKSLLNLYLKYGPNHESSLTLRKALEDLLKKSLKHNPRLRKAFITGVFPCAKYDLLSKIDVLDCNVFNPYFGRDFGLTEMEVFELVGHMATSKLEKIMDFYLGYAHGNQTKLANPYSIMNVLLSNGVVKPYWPSKEDVKVFNKALKIYYKHDYKTLMSGEAIPNIYLSQKLKLSEVIEPENLLEMLVYNGYLTAIPSQTKDVPLKRKMPGQNKNETVVTTITFHNVTIPNREILTAFHKIIRKENKEKLQNANEGEVKEE